MPRIKQFKRHAVKRRICFFRHLFTFTPNKSLIAYFLFKSQYIIRLYSALHSISAPKKAARRLPEY
ncbi:hypothetical protein B9T34_17390 [Acinetobacter sp. ANC 3813]|nr:hypothetical protein B9T34_17390 [Acinetobacter sp. ANC 3813]